MKISTTFIIHVKPYTTHTEMSRAQTEANLEQQIHPHWTHKHWTIQTLFSRRTKSIAFFSLVKCQNLDRFTIVIYRFVCSFDAFGSYNLVNWRATVFPNWLMWQETEKNIISHVCCCCCCWCTTVYTHACMNNEYT